VSLIWGRGALLTVGETNGAQYQEQKKKGKKKIKERRRRGGPPLTPGPFSPLGKGEKERNTPSTTNQDQRGKRKEAPGNLTEETAFEKPPSGIGKKKEYLRLDSPGGRAPRQRNKKKRSCLLEKGRRKKKPKLVTVDRRKKSLVRRKRNGKRRRIVKVPLAGRKEKGGKGGGGEKKTLGGKRERENVF